MASRLLTASVSVVAAFGLFAPGQPVSSVVVGSVREHTVAPGDTVRSLSARFGVGEAVIAADNALPSGRRPLVGQILRIDTRHIAPPESATTEMVINIPQRHVFLSPDGLHVTAYPIAVGRADWRTPLGVFTIIEKELQPVWDVPLSIQEEMRRLGQRVQTTVPPGRDNPLGAFFIRSSFPSVGLHGTTSPNSIYRFATHGCLRLHPEDIAEVFEQVAVGTRGQIVYQPILLARTVEGILLEAHPDAYRKGGTSPIDVVRGMVEGSGLAEGLDWQAVRDVLTQRSGTARLVSVSQRPLTDPTALRSR
jgi:L,D-transpeptidase ErfK/SrfK